MIYSIFQNNNKSIFLIVSLISLICLSSCGLFSQNNSSEVFEPFQQIQNIPCESDSDCVLVNEACCGCNNGGKSIAIHFSQREAYNGALKSHCDRKPPTACKSWYRCQEFQTQCYQSQCVVNQNKNRNRKII